MKKISCILMVAITVLLCAALLSGCQGRDLPDQTNREGNAVADGSEADVPGGQGPVSTPDTTSKQARDVLPARDPQWGSGAKYHGSIVATENEYTLEYATFDSSMSSTMQLKQGDILCVACVVDAGELSAKILDGDEDVFYENERMETGSFTLEIDADGTYEIFLLGRNNQGSVSFKKQVD